MWNNLARALSIAVLAVGGLAGYLFWDDAKQREHLEEAQAQNQELGHEGARLKEQVGYLSQRLEQDIAKVSNEKQEELARLAKTHDEMVESLKQEIAAGEITITRLADRLSVKIVDKILFPSGEAAIGDEGGKVLARVAKVIAGAKDKVIRIEGHADNVPIGKHLVDRFATNWELSTARATTIARFLQENTKIDPTAFEAVGLGEYHPVADNLSAKGRSQNRRIEIILYPRVRTLAKELPAKPGKRGAP